MNADLRHTAMKDYRETRKKSGQRKKGAVEGGVEDAGIPLKSWGRKGKGAQESEKA